MDPSSTELIHNWLQEGCPYVLCPYALRMQIDIQVESLSKNGSGREAAGNTRIAMKPYRSPQKTCLMVALAVKGKLRLKVAG
jgi:hypothetical protein